MLQRVLQSIAVAALIATSTSAAWSQQDIRWGTPPVGTAGHKAGVALANLLNKEMPAIPHLGAADGGRHRHRQGLCHQGA